jgi:hypothetical protein
MIGSFRREIFGHWLEETEEEKGEKPSTSRVDLRQFLKEPGALKELTSFFKAIKEAESEKEEQKKKARPVLKPKPKQKKK